MALFISSFLVLVALVVSQVFVTAALRNNTEATHALFTEQQIFYQKLFVTPTPVATPTAAFVRQTGLQVVRPTAK